MLGVTLGSLYVDAQGYVPALMENLRGMSCSGTYWLLGGGWFQCRYGGFWTVSYYLKFHVVRSFLVFSGLGLKSPASGFQFYSSSSLKTSPTTLRETQRGSQGYMKKRRGRRETEMSRRRKGGTQEERDKSTQYSVP